MLVTKVGVTLNCTCQHFRYTLCLSLCMHTLCFSAARTCVCIMCFMGGMRPRSCVHATVMPRVVSSSAFSHFNFFFLWPSTLPYLALKVTDRLSAQCPMNASKEHALPRAPVAGLGHLRKRVYPPQNRQNPGTNPW